MICVQASCYFPREPSSLCILPSQFPLLRDGSHNLSNSLNTTSYRLIHNCQQNQDQRLLYLMSTLLCTSTSLSTLGKQQTPQMTLTCYHGQNHLKIHSKTIVQMSIKPRQASLVLYWTAYSILVILTCVPTNPWP